MERALLLGGPRHFEVVQCGNYGTPITTGNGTKTVTHYHRAVFRFPITGASVDRFWYVYETDEYRGSRNEIPLSDIHQKLLDEKIPPVNEAVDVINFTHERTIREVPPA